MTAGRSIQALALAAAAGLAVAACGPGTTATATATPGAASMPAASEAAVATDANPLPSLPDLGSFSIPSFSSDSELEGLLPDEIGGETVTKFSMTGDSFLGTGGTGTEELDKILGDLGKTPADLSVAFAGNTKVTLIAYRIKGVPATTFFSGFLAAAQTGGSDVQVTDANVSGKSVKKIVSSDSDVGTVYVYGSGDVMFLVAGDAITDALLAETFSQLP